MSQNNQYLLSVFICNLIVFIIYIYIKRKKKWDYKKNKSIILRTVLQVLFIFYITSVLAVTVVPLPYSKAGTPYLNLDLFRQTYYNLLSAFDKTSERTVLNEVENLLGNVVIFMPFGFLLPLLYKKKDHFIIIFFLGLLFSFLIETTQYLISIKWGYNRLADIDDLVLNTVGTIVGFFIYRIFKFFAKSLTNNLQY